MLAKLSPSATVAMSPMRTCLVEPALVTSISMSIRSSGVRSLLRSSET